MIRALAWLLLPLLASCQAEQPAPPATNGAQAAAGAEPAAVAAEPRQSANLTGTVSALSGDRSDLNVRVTDLGTVVDLPADALFDYDKATLTPGAEAELRKAAALIGRSPPGPIQVIGHSDSRGEDAYNLNLSEQRARTVADWFGQQVGVRQRSIVASGRGEAAPIAPNTTPEGADDPQGRAKNRRVEVVLPTAR